MRSHPGTKFELKTCIEWNGVFFSEFCIEILEIFFNYLSIEDSVFLISNESLNAMKIFSIEIVVEID